MEKLTGRQERLLRLIVHEYVAGGRAVGSKTLVETYSLAVSSATIRNEMVDLERAGLIEQPHTSAGRVPTDRGYRYYVEHLIGEPYLAPDEQMTIRHQFRQVESQLEGWMQLAASALAHTTGHVSVVTAPRTQNARLKHLELVGIQERLVLLILVTQASAVKQAVVQWPEPLAQAELREAADRLTARFAGQAADEVTAGAAEEAGFARLAAEQVADILRGLETASAVEMQHAGLEHALQQPEFAGGQAAGQIVELMEGGAFLSALLPQLRPADDVQVFIGGENVSDELRPYGIVVATYGVRREVIGLVGVVGPRRMAYERSIGTVRYVADLMSDLVGWLHAGGDDTRQ